MCWQACVLDRFRYEFLGFVILSLRESYKPSKEPKIPFPKTPAHTQTGFPARRPFNYQSLFFNLSLIPIFLSISPESELKLKAIEELVAKVVAWQKTERSKQSNKQEAQTEWLILQPNVRTNIAETMSNCINNNFMTEDFDLAWDPNEFEKKSNTSMTYQNVDPYENFRSEIPSRQFKPLPENLIPTVLSRSRKSEIQSISNSTQQKAEPEGSPPANQSKAFQDFDELSIEKSFSTRKSLPDSLTPTVLLNQKSEIPNSDTSIQSQTFQDEYVIKKSESFFGKETIQELRVKAESLEFIDPIHQEAERNATSSEKKSETVQDFDELFIKNFEKFTAEIEELKVKAKSLFPGFEIEGERSKNITPIQQNFVKSQEFKKQFESTKRSWLDSEIKNRAQNPPLSVNIQSQKTIKELKKERKRLELANKKKGKSKTEAQNYIKKEFQNSLQLQYSSNFSLLANMGYKPVNGTNASKTDAESEQREKGLKTALNSTNKGFSLLAKMGYRTGEGLGKSKSGITEPIGIKLRTGRKGFAIEGEQPKNTTPIQQNIVKCQEFKKPRVKKTDSSEFKFGFESTNRSWLDSEIRTGRKGFAIERERPQNITPVQKNIVKSQEFKKPGFKKIDYSEFKFDFESTNPSWLDSEIKNTAKNPSNTKQLESKKEITVKSQSLMKNSNALFAEKLQPIKKVNTKSQSFRENSNSETLLPEKPNQCFNEYVVPNNNDKNPIVPDISKEKVNTPLNVPPRKFQCEKCWKSFKCKDNYNLHVTIHIEKTHGNQICKICSKRFDSIDNLFIHMKTHKDTPKYHAGSERKRSKKFKEECPKRSEILTKTPIKEPVFKSQISKKSPISASLSDKNSSQETIDKSRLLKKPSNTATFSSKEPIQEENTTKSQSAKEISNAVLNQYQIPKNETICENHEERKKRRIDKLFQSRFFHYFLKTKVIFQWAIMLFKIIRYIPITTILYDFQVDTLKIGTF